MILLQTNGGRMSNWTSAEIVRSLDAISGSFILTVVADKLEPLPVKAGDQCTVSVNGTTVLTGYVDIVEVSYSYSTHMITVTGRDKTADIVDSHCDNVLEFKAPISMEEVCRKTLAAAGLSDVKIVNKVSGLKPFTKEELVAGKIGEKCFEFMDKYALKRQVVLTTDGLGSLVITRASESPEGYQLKNVIADNFNTIKTAQVTYDNSERYNKYIFVTQANYSADPKTTEKVSKATHRRSQATDDEIRPSRQYVAIDEGSSPEGPMKDRATWEKNLRKAKSFKYSCVHVDHSPYSYDGEPYKPNSLVRVEDEWAGVSQDLLVIKVTTRLSMTDGSTTELELLPREAFELLRSEKAKSGESSKSKEGGGGGGAKADFSKYDNSTSNFATKYKEKV